MRPIVSIAGVSWWLEAMATARTTTATTTNPSPPFDRASRSVRAMATR